MARTSAGLSPPFLVRSVDARGVGSGCGRSLVVLDVFFLNSLRSRYVLWREFL